MSDPKVIAANEMQVPPANNIPPLMRQSSKKLFNHRVPMPTKTLRMRSLLWVKPSIAVNTTSSVIAQLLPTLIVNLAAISSGLSLGFSAIVLPQLDMEYGEEGDGLYRPFTIGMEGGSWIASIFGLGAVVGGFAVSYLGARFGRRKSIIILAVPDLIGWIFIAAAQNLPMMLIGRFLNGFCAAGFSPSIQIYIAEIAQPQHRGWLSAITMPALAFGAIVAYCLGSVISWHWVALIGVFVPLFLIPGVCCLYDSPYWYLQNNQDRKAVEVIQKFRAPDANGLGELLAISENLKVDAEEFSLKDSLKNLHRRHYRRPFVLLNILFFIMNFSGNFAISFYAVEIFKKASEGMDGYISTIIMGVIKFLGSLLYIPAIKYFTRRMLLCTSSLVMGVSLCILGLAMYSHETGNVGEMGKLYWLPLLCVTVYMLADPIGLGSIPFLYTAEFFPAEMRSVLSGITIGLSNLELFIVVKTFPNISDQIGSHGTIWIYAGFCFAAVIFTLMAIPETRGKSLEEVESYFGRKESLHVTPFHSPVGTPVLAKKGLASYPHLSLQFTL